MKLIIVGGVAGGAAAATRARRLSEETEITIYERGSYISFANCGLPYYIGGDIADREKLLITTPDFLKKRFNIAVHTLMEVTAIDRLAKTVTVKNLKTSETFEDKYDVLILSPGANPVKPPIPGIDLPGIYTLRTIDDMDTIVKAASVKPQHVTVVGGGYIGVEVAENLAHKGISVAVIEATPQVMAPFDPELATLLHAELQEKGISLHLQSPVQAFEQNGKKIDVLLPENKRITTDFVVFSIGVRPETSLAKQAGLDIGHTGGIKVNERMQTSDQLIYAVGDACEVRSLPLSIPKLIPLAGPAARQGRIAANNIFGISSFFRGTQGTAVIRVFSLTAACTGANEKTLRKESIPYEKIYLTPSNHAEYYPAAEKMVFKLLFDKTDGRILGAQIVGKEGVDKRIDIIATAIQANMTVFSLEETELAYAPPYGSAKDPVNMAGFIASNHLRGTSMVIHWDTPRRYMFLIDVRTKKEWDNGHDERAVHIPLDELRQRLNEIPSDREIGVYCHSGMRSYIASQILRNSGFRAKNISGGYFIRELFKNIL